MRHTSRHPGIGTLCDSAESREDMMAGMWRLAAGFQVGKSATAPVLVTSRRHFASGSPKEAVRIGCASGFWGDTPTAAPQLIHHGRLDFLMFDYLSEITMSLLTAARAKKPELGFAPDFVLHALGPHLAEMKRQGIRVLSNAGGINPEGCAAALRQAAKKAGADIKVGVVMGDNLMALKNNLLESNLCDLSSGLPLPRSAFSINAYLGAAGMVRALDEGADVVVTGRCADSALALAPLMHSFGWGPDDLDQLAAGSLAGHLIECGAQVTGGIFTDWQTVPDWHNIGFPIAEVSPSGRMVITKPEGTGGLVSVGTVSEQLLYEIGDPRAYVLPDVVCDLTDVRMANVEAGVEVWGAKGKAPTNKYKVSTTYLDGYKATAVCAVGGPHSAAKGHRTAKAILTRCRAILKSLGMSDYERTHVQVLGAEDTYGPHGRADGGPREGVIWFSATHKNKKALEVLGMEIAAAGTGMAPGLTAIVGGRPKPSPVLRLHSSLIEKERCKVKVTWKARNVRWKRTPNAQCQHPPMTSHTSPPLTFLTSRQALTGNHMALHVTACHQFCSYIEAYRLEELAYTRSGDKGDSCNVGVVARCPSLYPYLQQALTAAAVGEYFNHVWGPEVGPDAPQECVKRQ
ncbi:hypothetical protein GWK47_016202 [Chionoecetes opilio]|uniref:Uncharacterized protein n=1 Tax=Chionoecetes opilio TaxID=41210 RepID=A0A8J4XS19_CHIOP|nr:hypothetical protein GWK47_016202 [Chionoecetes opilio]